VRMIVYGSAFGGLGCAYGFPIAVPRVLWVCCGSALCLPVARFGVA
jgi:hypothetical protein